MIQQLLQQEILKDLGRKQGRIVFTFLFALCILMSENVSGSWGLDIVEECYFLHQIWCGTSRSRTCSGGHSASAGSASPSSTSSLPISSPGSEDPKGHFWSRLQSQRLVFWDPAPAHSFLGFQVAAVPDSSNSYSLLHPCLCWRHRGCPQVAVSLHLSSVSRLIDYYIYNYQTKHENKIRNLSFPLCPLYSFSPGGTCWVTLSLLGVT